MKENTPTNLLENLNKLHYSSRRVAMELLPYTKRDNVFSLSFMDGHLEDVQFDLGIENCLSLNEIFYQLVDINIIEVDNSLQPSEEPEFDLNLSLNDEYVEILTEEIENLL